MAAVLDSVVGDSETFAADGAPLMSDEAVEDEEILADDGASAKNDPFDAALAELEVLMMDEGLTAAVDAFTKEHCGVFEPGDENKLEYTTLFTQYTTMVEQYIETQIGASIASFDMASFCATLAERSKGDESLLDHPALEMLFAYTDFDAFKSMMLATREGAEVEAESGSLCVSGDKLGLAGVDGEMPDAEDDDDLGGEIAPDMGLSLSISGVKAK